MDCKDWLILKTIKEEGNLTKAAERLYISQPALSYRLQNLEKDIGVRILTRCVNGVSFTPQGEYLLKYAEEMLDKLEYVKNFVRSMESQPQGSLRLGVSSVIAKFKIAPLLKKFRKKFPNVEIALQTGSSTLQLPDMLRKKEVDIVILRGDVSWQDEKHVIDEEPMCIVYSKPIEFERLSQVTWFQYEASTITKSEVQHYEWWQEQFHCPPPKIVKVDSIEACIQMVSHGLGWCIAPKIHIKNRRSLFSCPVILRDGSIMLRKTTMLFHKEILEQPACKQFIDFILREYPS